MKLTLHLPAKDDGLFTQVKSLPECSLLSESKVAQFVFMKGIDRLRDEARIQPDPQTKLAFAPGTKSARKASKKGKRK